VPDEIVADFRAVRDAYNPAKRAEPDPRRHLTTFRGYMTELKPWQYALVTERVLDSTSIAGTAGQCADKIARLEQHGIGRIILSPLPQYAEQTIEAYGHQIIPRFTERSRNG
jgi:alkanesulfonate monooxygenase SsuD/methylene tetrahydromethanopterin reductase-like flavin-dependent oxidoreductase (luciferase family)